MILTAELWTTNVKQLKIRILSHLSKEKYFFFGQYWRQTFIKECFWNCWFLKHFIYKNVPIFCRFCSWGLTMTWYSEKMPKLIKKSWTVSNWKAAQRIYVILQIVCEERLMVGECKGSFKNYVLQEDGGRT